MKRTVALMLMLASGPAALASDDNFFVSNLYDESNIDDYWNVASSEMRQALFQDLSRGLGLAVSYKHLAPAETLGAYGFEVGLDTSVVFVPQGETCDVDSAVTQCQYQYDRENAFRVMDADHRLTFGNAMLLPTLRLRKGLPFSTEVGMDMAYLSFSHQGAVTGYFRGAFNEGFARGKPRIVPDVALTIARTRFVGNEELGLSVANWDLTFGWTVPVAGIKDSYVGTFSPFLGVGRTSITAVPFPNVLPSDQLSTKMVDLTGVTGKRTKEQQGSDTEETIVYDENFRPLGFHLGFRLTGGEYRVVSGVELPYNSKDHRFDPPVVSVGVGFSY